MKLFYLVILLVSALPTLHAKAQIPGIIYPQRFYPYQGWSAIARGDTNTVGMAGATVALPNSISAIEANPAGLAMTLGGFAAQINSYTLRDPELNRSAEDAKEYQWGAATSMPPWGFGISYYSPKTELVSSSEASVRQLRFGVARLIRDDLSVGLSLEVNNAIRSFDHRIYNAATIGWRIGALYKLEDHWVLGVNYAPGLEIGKGEETNLNPSSGFNQPTIEPQILNLGIGFMPNRFFKAGASIQAVAATEGTRLLYDQTIGYGENFSLQPRVGASYILLEYNWIKAELAVGSYYESTRIGAKDSRLHGTFGLEVNPWFVNTGVGGDFASHYKNFSVSLGVDIVRTLRHFEIIPPDTVPPYNGYLPKIEEISADGLPDGFTLGEEKTMAPPSASDVKNIVEGIPERVEAVMNPDSQAAKNLDAKKKKSNRKTKPKKKSSR
jgi:hypothetical protein